MGRLKRPVPSLEMEPALWHLSRSLAVGVGADEGEVEMVGTGRGSWHGPVAPGNFRWWRGDEGPDLGCRCRWRNPPRGIQRDRCNNQASLCEREK